MIGVKLNSLNNKIKQYYCQMRINKKEKLKRKKSKKKNGKINKEKLINFIKKNKKLGRISKIKPDN